MTDALQIIIAFIFLGIAFLLCLAGRMWLTRKAVKQIIRYLKEHEATSLNSAIELPFTKKGFFSRMGVRDYRPQALNYLVQQDIVRQTENQTYFLAKDPSFFTV